MISLFLNPAPKNASIVRKPSGITHPFFRISPIITAHFFPCFRTRYASTATFSMLAKKAFTFSRERSPSIPSLYLMMSAYGGCVHMKSTPSSFKSDRLAASALLTIIMESLFLANSKFFSVSLTACGLISVPTALRFSSFASINVVPLPINWSKTQSPGFVYRRIKFRGT